MMFGIGFGVLALLGLYGLFAGWAPTLWKTSLGVAVPALLVCLAGEFLALRRLGHGIIRAREGLLDPVSLRGLQWTYTGRQTRQYNETVQTLQTMFRTVEECQGLFLSQRNRMNTLLQSLPGALLSLNDDLQVVLANKQAEELFTGRSPMGRNLFDLLLLGEGDRALLRDAFLYKQPILNQEISLGEPGSQRYFSLNLGFYSDEDNALGGVLILQDISAYRRLQETVAMREKLVAMGQLAAGVAHELNTPLGSIQGYAQLLRQSLHRPEELAEYAGHIADETKRCARIVQDLLNYARADRCSGETCELNQLIRELIETFLNCRMKRYRIEVELDLLAQGLVVEGGCGQLDIVLTNLLVNAIHALDGVAQPRITLSTRLHDAYAIISVTDNGPGVPDGQYSRIFDPFFTTKQVGEGSGLGLPICHAILAKRGGFILYDKDYQEGARFLIKLPAVDTQRAGMGGSEN
ncbi:MAG TPA: histidine kinase dimerization/phospho-acceptor domain-containing protein [Thiobacillaceae bacterium]|nr:histidine kinase dimerization/phospho-acceptor domain-containing protein [Thiobacillaceae bacterium]HNU63987.1 histidine kinase dimerization/phospho-acceptor domain-containing protein [Thiobacillaceae bacterium]